MKGNTGRGSFRTKSRARAFPNGRMAPHQERNAKTQHKLRTIISAQELGADFEPNRAQRRDYVRLNQTRNVRRNVVGFGRWRRHVDREDFPIAPRPDVNLAPRRERRPAMIAAARAARRIVRIHQR